MNLTTAREAIEDGDDEVVGYHPEGESVAAQPSPQSPEPSARQIRTTHYQPAPPASRPNWSARPDAMPHATGADEASETIRLPTAADGTVQLLPGMLIMTEGPEVGREYRFLRVGSQPVPELTLGRISGPSYRHIQLAVATVSRMHARVRYEEGVWRVANLSMTNPLRLNGLEIPHLQDAALKDGDRIQLGEVELSYHDRR